MSILAQYCLLAKLSLTHPKYLPKLARNVSPVLRSGLSTYHAPSNVEPICPQSPMAFLNLANDDITPIDNVCINSWSSI